MSPEEKLLLQVCYAVVEARESMKNASARGDEKARDAFYSRYQVIRDSIRMVELNRSWR